MAGPPGTLVGRLRVKVLPDTSTFGTDLRRQLADEGRDDVEVTVTPFVNQASLRRAELQLERLARTRFARINTGVDNRFEYERTAALLERIAESSEETQLNTRETGRLIDRLNGSLDKTRTAVRQVNRETSKRGSIFSGGDLDTPGGSFRALDPTRILVLLGLLTSPAIVATIATLGAAIGGLSAGLTGAAGGAGILALAVAGLSARVVKFREDGTGGTDALRDFSDAIDGVKDAYTGFLDSIEDEGFESLTMGAGIIERLLPRLTPIFSAFNKQVQTALTGIGKFISGPEGQRMLDFFEGVGSESFGLLLEILGNLLRFFGRLFEALGPFALELLEGIADATLRWADAVDGLDRSKRFQGFLDFVRRVGPKVYELFTVIGSALGAIGEALAPLAEGSLDGLIGLFRSIADLDPTVLEAVVVGITASLGALLAISAILALISLANPVVVISAALLGLAAAAAVFVESSDGLKGRLDDLVDGILGLESVQTAIDNVTGAFDELFKRVSIAWSDFQPTLDEIKDDLGGILRDATPELEENLVQFSETFAKGLELLGITISATLAGISNIWGTWGDELSLTLSGAIKIILNVAQIGLAVLETVFAYWIAILTGDWSSLGDELESNSRTTFKALGGIFTGGLMVLVALMDFYASLLPEEMQESYELGKQYTREFFKNWQQDALAGLEVIYGLFSRIGTTIRGYLDIDLSEQGRRILKSLADGIREGIDTIRRLLQGLTADIPTWKGPMSVDSRLLAPNADAIMDSFINRVESRLGDVRNVLGGLGLSSDLGGLTAGGVASRYAPQVNLTVSAANEQEFVENVSQAAQRGVSRSLNLQWNRV